MVAIVSPLGYLGIIDLIIVIGIILSLLGLAWKFEGRGRYISILLAISLIAIVIVTPVDELTMSQLGKLGIVAIPILLALDVILPPWPTGEIIIIFLLKMVKEDIPLWMGEVVAIVFAVGLLFLIEFFMPNTLGIVIDLIIKSLSQINIFTGILFLIWTSIFIVMMLASRDSS